MATEVSGSAGPVVGIAVKTTVLAVGGGLRLADRDDPRDWRAMSSVSAGHVGGVDAGGVQVDDDQQRRR